MGRCSYSWEEWNEEKDEFVKKCCQKEVWKGSGEFCIFHDPSVEKDVNLFKKKIEEEMETETAGHNFIGYIFPENFDFSGKEFGLDVNFEGATFLGFANFRGATFLGNSNFKGATFLGIVDFWFATFKDAYFGEAIFKDAFFGQASFRNAYFGGATFKDAYFGGATFCGTLNFGKATLGHANFIGTTFKCAALFDEASFLGNTDFWAATFESTANFGGATFEHANFTGTKFRDDACFEVVTFEGTAGFREVVFKDADFQRATFKDIADFEGTAFQGTIDFRRAVLKKKLSFAPIRVERIDLRDAEFLFRSKVTANLKEALYQGAFVENVAFNNCEWPVDHVIYEERHMNDEKINLSFSQLETVYRDLKQNMQRYGDYSEAGNFYYREMECRKRKIRGRGPSFRELTSHGYSVLRYISGRGEKPKKSLLDWLRSYGYSLLKCTCGYGEKPFRVIAVAAIIVMVFAFFFQFGGIVIGEYTPRERTIDSDIHLAFPTENGVKDYLQCLYFSFVTFTTLGYGDIHPIGYSKTFASAEAFTGAFFIALFVLVFGRKMMR